MTYNVFGGILSLTQSIIYCSAECVHTRIMADIAVIIPWLVESTVKLKARVVSNTMLQLQQLANDISVQQLCDMNTLLAGIYVIKP